MNDTDVCVCGHVADEHEQRRSGPVECTVEGCGCVQFELADEGDDDD